MSVTSIPAWCLGPTVYGDDAAHHDGAPLCSGVFGIRARGFTIRPVCSHSCRHRRGGGSLGMANNNFQQITPVAHAGRSSLMILKSRFGSRILVACILSPALLWTAAVHATSGGFYIGGSLGQARLSDIGELETACDVAGVLCVTDDSDTAFRIFAGYQFGRFFALEAGYVDLGEQQVGVEQPVLAEAALETHGGFLALLPQIPIGKIGAVYGRVGLYGGDATLTARVPSFGFDESDSSAVAGVAFGFGGALNFDRFTIRIEWERVSFDEAFTIAGEDIDAPDLDIITGSALIRF